MSNALMIHEENNPMVRIRNTQAVCAELMKQPHYAKMGAEGVFAVVTAAQSLNVDPIQALNGSLYYMKGKVGMSTELMASLIRSKGHSICMDEKSDNNVCILRGKRVDSGDTWKVRFSIEDAKRAGIYSESGSWGKYPTVMLYNRAMSILARQLFPDVIKGMGYNKDELHEMNAPQVVSFEEIKEPCISEEKAMELHGLLAICTQEHQDRVWATLHKQDIISLSDLSEDLYSRIKASCLKNVKPPELKEVELPPREAEDEAE